MEKYLSVDTNIFIQCCLLEEQGDNIDALNKLHELLENNSLKLLLPEVVELEFYKRLEEKTLVMQRQIDGHKETIAKDSSLDKKVKADIIESLRHIMEDRLKNKSDVEDKIKTIFSHKNTIKENLEITPELLSKAYKYHLTGKKPYKKTDKKTEINISAPFQPDCIIIQSLADYFEGKTDYELYFCSLNESDFAEGSNPKEEAKNENPKIHPEISRNFHHIEYRKNLFNLLNEKFGTKFPEESIKKLEEKGVIVELSVKDVVGISDSAEIIVTAESEGENPIDIVSKEENNIASS